MFKESLTELEELLYSSRRTAFTKELKVASPMSTEKQWGLIECEYELQISGFLVCIPVNLSS